jgi:hypothetical protein
MERGVGSSLKFVADQFARHVETVTEHAKIEINAYAEQTLRRTGLAALQSGASSPISLPEEEKKG